MSVICQQCGKELSEAEARGVHLCKPAEEPPVAELTKELRRLAGCFWKSSNKMERVQTKIIEACDIIDRLTAENKAQAERIEKLEKALDTMLQAFDPEHPAACDQECFDTSDGHGYEMQDLAKSRA